MCVADREGFVRVRWEPPASDGGDAVQNYLVESRSGATGRWTPVNAGYRLTDCELLVDAREGTEYSFRVTAMNRAGAGRPSATSEPFVYGTYRRQVFYIV